MSFLQKISPLSTDLRQYTQRDFFADLTAGLTVGVMLIPQGMAYAVLAGLPAIYGLYGGLIPIILYAFFGTSRQLAIGPVAVSSILVAEGISKIAGVAVLTPEFVGYAIAAGFFIGIFQFLFGLLRMGFLVNFLSQPVIAGFTTAAAFVILGSQLADLLGFPISRELSLPEKFQYAFTHLPQTNLIAFSLCVLSMLLILFLKKINKIIPGALIVVVLGTLISYVFNLPEKGLEIVGKVPEGLPHFELPDFSFETLQKILPTVLTVTIIGIVECIGIAKAIENKHQSYIVKPNQELLAIGIAKIGGAFFQAMPSSGSFTRSAINHESGARTTIASLFTAALIGLTLLFFTPIFYYLPTAVLAAIILLAIRSLVEWQTAINLWRYHRSDFVLMAATFLVTLFLGIEEGVLAGVVLSVMNVMYRSSKPHIAILGIVPGKTYYRNIERFDAIEQETDALIVRFDSQLYFANAGYFKDRIRALILEEKRQLRCFFLDAKSVTDIDSSGLSALRDIHTFLKKKNIEFYVCGAIGPVRDRLKKSGFTDEIGDDHWFISLHDGVQYYRDRKNVEK